jgi:hypothetical protein
VKTHDYIVKLKAALREAVLALENQGLLSTKVLQRKLLEFRLLANEQAPLVDGSPDAVHKMKSFQRYVEQLEALAKKVAEDGGLRATEAQMILGTTNLKVLGVLEDRPITGVFDLEVLKAQGKKAAPRPSLKEPCGHPARASHGRHEEYIDGSRTYCRACGAEEYRKVGGIAR